MLVDTDVLIDYLRGLSKAAAFLESNLDVVAISAMSVAELYQRVREGEERMALSDMVSVLTVLPITESVAKEAGLLRRQYRKTNNAGLADCLIASTALAHDLPLRTLNVKHYPMLKDVSAPYHKRA